MHKPDFPSISLQEWQLRRQLHDRKTHYAWQNLRANLTVSPPPDSVDLQLCIHWHDHTLSLLCHQSALARWLAPQLQEAALTTLPEPLLLALLERESAVLPMLIWDSISTSPVISRQHTLSIELNKGADTLVFWLHEVPAALVRSLDKRPVDECLAVPLILSLQLCMLPLSLSQLNELTPGDILLLDAKTNADTLLLSVGPGYPWCFCRFNQSTLEITTMHPLHTPVEQEQPVNSLDELPVNISFEIGRKTLDLRSLLHLQPGSLLDLDCPPDGEIRILANQRYLGTGRLVNIQNRLGVQVVTLLTDRGSHDTAP